jgi:hypothetical protein
VTARGRRHSRGGGSGSNSVPTPDLRVKRAPEELGTVSGRLRDRKRAQLFTRGQVADQTRADSGVAPSPLRLRR